MERVKLIINEIFQEDIEEEIHNLLDDKISIGISHFDINTTFIFRINKEQMNELKTILRRKSIIYRLDILEAA